MTAAIEHAGAGASTLTALLGGDIVFPTGLLGFPNCRRFNLSRFEPGDGNESPFFILNSIDQELSFVVIHPDFVSMDYSVPLFAELLESLGAKSDTELVPLLIVTVRDRVENITVNLQGPLLISVLSRIGMQSVVEEFPLRHPLVSPPNP
jgi:flagellar assembly factor FliW